MKTNVSRKIVYVLGSALGLAGLAVFWPVLAACVSDEAIAPNCFWSCTCPSGFFVCHKVCPTPCICRNLECMRAYLKQLNEWADGYDALSHRLMKDVPLESYDLSAMSEGARDATIKKINAQYQSYQQGYQFIHDHLITGLGSACPQAGEFEATVTEGSCVLDRQKLNAAKEKAPCKEIGDAMEAHEQYHQAQCLTRMARNFRLPRNQYQPEITRPAIMLSQGGQAAEEARAHRIEAGVIKKALDSVTNKCMGR